MKPVLEKGAVLDSRYEIIQVLGSGEFGVVYQARDTQGSSPETMVAIKELPMQSIIDCERQADVRALLKHPAIPAILGYFCSADHSYLVHDLVVGWDLERVLDRQNTFLAEKVVVDWAIQLCDFLDYLHNHPIYPMIFRDMKPNNVMVDRGSRIHVVDFGLARVFPPGFFENPQEPFAHFWKGLAIGTEGYSPPEQYEGVVKPQSDIYALGATLHHLLTRRDPRKYLPFSLYKYPVRSFNPAISEKLEEIVMKSVDLDIGSRFASAREMKQALEALPNG